MKIAIISDTHDNLANMKKIVEWLNKEKINLLLHCGDISNKETLNEIIRTFNGGVKFVCGNADHDLENLQEVGEIEVGSNPPSSRLRRARKIAFTHFPEMADNLAVTQKYDLVFYGHTHRPWEHKANNCRLINPGEVAGQFYKPTFAIYDATNDKLELKILEKL